MARQSGIERLVQILNHLAEVGRPSTGYSIAKAIGASPSTIYPIIEDLIQHQLLTRDAGSEVWLGPRIHRYGLAYVAALDLMKAAVPVMRELCEATGETVQLCGRDGRNMTVLAMEEGPRHFQVNSRVGSRVPLNWTASGRLLIGFLPYEERLAFFKEHAVASPTGRALTDPQALAKAAGESYEEGFSVQLSESDFAVACIAAPIRADSACIATMSLVLPEQRVIEARESLIAAVMDAARKVEVTMGTGAAA